MKLFICFALIAVALTNETKAADISHSVEGVIGRLDIASNKQVYAAGEEITLTGKFINGTHTIQDDFAEPFQVNIMDSAGKRVEENRPRAIRAFTITPWINIVKPDATVDMTGFTLSEKGYALTRPGIYSIQLATSLQYDGEFVQDDIPDHYIARRSGEVKSNIVRIEIR